MLKMVFRLSSLHDLGLRKPLNTHTMTPHTVGLLAHTGRTGSAALRVLLEAHRLGKINLVVLFRPGSNLSTIDKDVETRELDLSAPDTDKIKAAVKGLNVLISLVAISGLQDQIHLFDPLAATPGFVSFIPPIFGIPTYTRDVDPEDERLQAFLSAFRPLIKIPQSLGLGVTRITCGVFTDYFFDEKYVDTDIDANSIHLYGQAMNKGMALTSSEALAEAIGEIATRQPETIKDKTFHVYDYSPTGTEIIQTLESLHGTKPVVIDVTEDDYQKVMDSGSMAISPAHYKHTWGTGDWNWPGERLGPRDRDFRELAKVYWAKRVA